MILRLVEERTFHMNESEVRAAYPYGKVMIHYAFDNYSHDVKHVLDLREQVRKDYPKMSDRDMQVMELSKTQTIRHAGLTTLFVGIPIDDYLKLRKEDRIDIR
ncbi:MAG: hypothetical protein IKK43_03885 [Clostridia bacterium]|nr:hypothetical protein [Clostridia bacterium]